jgi:hypothetical protein
LACSSYKVETTIAGTSGGEVLAICFKILILLLGCDEAPPSLLGTTS